MICLTHKYSNELWAAPWSTATWRKRDAQRVAGCLSARVCGKRCGDEQRHPPLPPLRYPLALTHCQLRAREQLPIAQVLQYCQHIRLEIERAEHSPIFTLRWRCVWLEPAATPRRVGEKSEKPLGEELASVQCNFSEEEATGLEDSPALHPVFKHL